MKTKIAIALLVLSFSSPLWAGITGFYYEGKPGVTTLARSFWDYNQATSSLSGGICLLENGWQFTLNSTEENLAGYNALYFRMTYPTGYWTLNIQAPNNGKLVVGQYTATRYPFQEPGLHSFNWGGNYSGLNTSTSFVNILEVKYSQSSPQLIESLAVDFVQFQETWGNLNPNPETTAWVYGSFRYNSSVPMSVPEPTTSLMIIGPIALGLCRRKK